MSKNCSLKRVKICLISSSGGHFEQLQRLKPLASKYDVFIVTERTDYKAKADYLLVQDKGNKLSVYIRLIINFFISLYIWIKEKPDYVISTGTLVAIPMLYYAKIFGRKTIYIETFARIYDGTKAGKFFYGKTDFFIYQWETLKDIYPNGVYGGSIY